MTLTAILFIIFPIVVLGYGLYKHIYDWGLPFKFGSRYWSVGKYIWLIIFFLYLFIVMFVVNNMSKEMIGDAFNLKGSALKNYSWVLLVVAPPYGFFLAFFPHIYLNTLKQRKKLKKASIKSTLAIIFWVMIIFVVLRLEGG